MTRPETTALDARARAIATLVGAASATARDQTGPAEITAALTVLGLDGDSRTAAEDHVHRARREQSRLRRREQELAALFSSARELADIRDSAALLERLVERAHEMMGSDVTYLSEFDTDSRELRVRTTSGSVSPAFQRLVVPAGRGLASVIVETRAAQWVARYGDYPAERHEPTVDDAVTAEGLVSLLGVPMLAGDDVLGVLFVARRDEHEFVPEEIALLTALADHASVVLQTANSLRALQRSEDDARQALDRLTGHLAERDRSNVVHQRLVQSVLEGGGFSPVAETLASALGRAVSVIDDRGAVITTTDSEASATDLDAAAVRSALDESRATGHCVLVANSPVAAVAALTAGAQHFGAILLGAADAELGPVDVRTVERAAQVGALLALQQQAVADAEHRTQSELVADLLDDVPERREDVRRRALRLGIALEKLDSVLLFGVPGDLRSDAARALVPLVASGALVGEHLGFVTVVLDSRRQAMPTLQLRSLVSASISAPTLSIAPPIGGAIPAAFAVAHRTARLLAALGVDDIAADTDDYLPYSAVLDADDVSLRAFLDSTIGAVRRYDDDRGSELLATLRVFVRVNASPTRAARELNFHTNTILQRLDRLGHVLGDDWRSDERLFRISIAVRLDEMIERLAARDRDRG